MKYEAVIFDLFGTLIDSFSTREYERALADMASFLSAPVEKFVELWMATYDGRATGQYETTARCVEHVCAEIGLRPSPRQVAAAAQMRLDFTRRGLIPRDGSVETLTWLKRHAYKTGLISDCAAEVPLLWPTTPLCPLIDVPIFSCSVGLKKPDPRIYRLACQRLGVKPEKCVYVGDGGSRELSGAAALGMLPIMIRLPDDQSDAHRLDTEDWPGDQIAELREITAFLECPDQRDQA